jgi:O-antigen/teichoic acid export membrane protein
MNYFLGFAALSFASIFIPLTSEALFKKDYEGIGARIYKFERFIYVFIVPLVIFVAVFSDAIVSIALSKRYMLSARIITVSSVATLFFILSEPYKSLLFSGSAFKKLIRIYAFTLLMIAGLEYFFVSKNWLNMGPIGASWSVLIGYAYLFIALKLCVTESFRQIKVHKYLKYIFYAIFNFIFFYYFYNTLFPWLGRGFKVLFPFIYFIVTYMSLFLLRLIDRGDLLILKGALSIKLMKEYVRMELSEKKLD